MSIIKRCDICGKHSLDKKTNFDERPLKIQIPNFKKKNYNFYLTLQLESAKDTETIKNIEEKEKQKLIESFMTGREHTPIELDENIKFENPYPMICNKCKKEIIKLIMNYGSYDKHINIIDI